MRIVLSAAAAVIAGGLLSGCATGASSQPATRPVKETTTVEVEQLVSSDVDPSSPPGFLATEQRPIDRLSDEMVTIGNLDPASSRFQGEWKGRQYFLAVQGDNGVHVVNGIAGDDRSWGVWGGAGNAVLGSSDGDGTLTMQYLPQGTSVIPDGWTALSAFLIVK